MPVKPWRLMVKAIVIFGILNFAIIYIYPWLSDHQVYNHIVPGRLRFPWAQPDLELTAHSLSVYDDMDSMFSSHMISAKDKPADEFRVIFLGDSSIWGDGISVPETLPEQINRLDLQDCRNQHIVAYNLALPSLYIMKDFLILNEAMKYKPDLIVWGVTLRSLADSDQNASLFLPSQSDEALYLINHYRLNISTAILKPRPVWDQTLFADRVNLKNLMILQADALPWIATNIDDHVTSMVQIQIGNDINPKSTYMLHSSIVTDQDLMLDVLSAADDLVRPAPLLIVNEPIFIATGKNSQQYYDAFYPRPLYDQYRNLLADWARSKDQPYIDVWNTLPSSEFTDSPLHLTPAGEHQLAAELKPVILNMACK